MNGAESLVRTLVGGGVEVCFTNPGTSEMHIVGALDRAEGMRCVLGLFEGVVTGAADGYYRMRERPAATLLHLGPGLANGVANLHNAKKASSAIINIVGQHATDHLKYNSPLSSDIEGVARPVSAWLRTSADARSLARDAADAIAAATVRPGQIATLIVPADAAWNAADGPISVSPHAQAAAFSAGAVDGAARVLKGEGPILLLLGHGALREEGLELASRIAGRTGCTVMAQGFNPRFARGAGRMPLARIHFNNDIARDMLKDFRHIILVEARDPVAFFAYPGKPSLLKSEGCAVHTLTEQGDDTPGALRALASAVGAKPSDIKPHVYAEIGKPAGAITYLSIAQAIAAAIPENAIIVDEALTTGRGFLAPTAGARPHDWLQNMGGSIGFGTPVAAGAAIACPDRRVIALEGDGSAMYTVQALWTHARESLNITTVVFANRSYEILKGEFARLESGEPGRKATDMLTLDRPAIDWIALAKGMGVPAVAVSRAEDLYSALEKANASAGPSLIEVQM